MVSVASSILNGGGLTPPTSPFLLSVHVSEKLPLTPMRDSKTSHLRIGGGGGALWQGLRLQLAGGGGAVLIIEGLMTSLSRSPQHKCRPSPTSSLAILGSVLLADVINRLKSSSYSPKAAITHTQEWGRMPGLLGRKVSFLPTRPPKFNPPKFSDIFLLRHHSACPDPTD